MSEKSFQYKYDNQNLESCKHCGSFDFEMSRTYQNSIACARCGKFHKSLTPSLKSAGEVLDKMFDFAKKNGE